VVVADAFAPRAVILRLDAAGQSDRGIRKTVRGVVGGSSVKLIGTAARCKHRCDTSQDTSSERLCVHGDVLCKRGATPRNLEETRREHRESPLARFQREPHAVAGKPSGDPWDPRDALPLPCPRVSSLRWQAATSAGSKTRRRPPSRGSIPRSCRGG